MFIHAIQVILAQEATGFPSFYSTHAQLPSSVHGEVSCLWALSGLILKGSAKCKEGFPAVKLFFFSLKIWTEICMVERIVLEVPYLPSNF